MARLSHQSPGEVITNLVGGLRSTNGLAFDPRGDLFLTRPWPEFAYRLSGGDRIAPFANVVVSPDAQFKEPDRMAFASDETLYCAVLCERHACTFVERHSDRQAHRKWRAAHQSRPRSHGPRAQHRRDRGRRNRDDRR